MAVLNQPLRLSYTLHFKRDYIGKRAGMLLVRLVYEGYFKILVLKRGTHSIKKIKSSRNGLKQPKKTNEVHLKNMCRMFHNAGLPLVLHSGQPIAQSTDSCRRLQDTAKEGGIL